MPTEIQTLQKKELLLRSSQDIKNLIDIASQGGRLLSARQPVTLDKVLSNPNAMSIGYLRKQSDEHEQMIASLFILAIGEASRLFPNSFDSGSITDTAFMVMNEYPQLKAEEIVLILKNGIAGKYGKMYHAISCAAIMEWALQYQTERIAWFEERENKKRENNSKEKIISINPKVLQETKQLAENLQARRPKEKQESKYQTEVRKLFEEFWATSEFKGAIRFKKHQGRYMTAEEYVSAKLKETKIQ